MIKKLLTLLILLSFSIPAFSQPDYEKEVRSLKYIAGADVCKDSIFWRIVSYGKEVVPYLIDEIANTRETAIATLLNCPSYSLHPPKSSYVVGDIATVAIMEIIDLPAYDIIGILPNQVGQNPYYRAFWEELHRKEVFGNLKEARKDFQEQLWLWYIKNVYQLERVETSEALHTSGCRKPENITGYYAFRVSAVEPSDEDILADYILGRMDKKSGGFGERIYIVEDFFKGEAFPLEEVQFVAGYKEFKSLYDSLQFEDKVSYEGCTSKGKWNPAAPALQKNRLRNFGIIPKDKFYDYLYGRNDCPSGNIYQVSKPLYSKDGSYAYIEYKYRPRSHGKRSGSLILKKSEGKWQQLMLGPTLIE